MSRPTFQVAEAWTNGAVVAVKNDNGAYSYFINAGLTVNGQRLDSAPVVAVEISKVNLGIAEAKASGKYVR